MKKLISVLLVIAVLTAPVLAYEDIMPLDGGLVITLYGTQPLVLPFEGSPSGIAVAEDGTLWITDVWEKAVWTWDGETLQKAAGAGGETDILGVAEGGNKDGAFEEASFQTPYAIVPYQGGFAVSDTDNDSVRLLKDGAVTTLAEGLDNPTGLACDDNGNLYISDTGSNTVFMLTADGHMETYLSEGLSEPAGLCWYDGILYIADSGNHRILTVQGDGAAEVFAGGVTGGGDEDALYGGFYRNGSTERAGFSNPQGVLACEDGVYVADSGNGAVRFIQNGFVTTVGTVSDIYPSSPRGLALAGGRLLVCDLYARVVYGAQQPSVPEPAAGADTLVTRAQCVIALANLNTIMYPYEIITGYGTFDDVPGDAPFAEAVAWGVDNDLLAGTGGGLFRPEDTMTHEAVALLLYKYAELNGLDIGGRSDAEIENVSLWAAEALSWAVSEGFVDAADEPGELVTDIDIAEILSAFMRWM